MIYCKRIDFQTIFARFFYGAILYMNEFQLNPLYEKVISDLLEKQYSIVENFFPQEEVLASMRLFAKEVVPKFATNKVAAGAAAGGN